MYSICIDLFPYGVAWGHVDGVLMISLPINSTRVFPWFRIYPYPSVDTCVATLG